MVKILIICVILQVLKYNYSVTACRYLFMYVVKTPNVMWVQTLIFELLQIPTLEIHATSFTRFILGFF